MSEKVFQELAESIREAGQIMRGERKAGRVFKHPAPKSRARRSAEARLAVCVQTDDPALLILRKVYEISMHAAGRVRVIDEDGEAALYPAEFFIPLELPPKVERALRAAL